MDQPEAEPVISDRMLVNGMLTPATLFSDGRLQWSERGQRCLTFEKEVLGFAVEGSKIRIRAMVENRDEICCFGSRGKLVRRDFVLEPLSEESRRLWCQKLREYINSLGRPKRVFIFVNPFGGNKSASKIFIDDVKSLLEDAGVEFTVQETKHQRHAKQVVQTLDLTNYDGILCVSGDGVPVEVVNGLLEREDWDAAIKMPIGVIPAGTGNGMVKSLLDSVGDPCTITHAILAIIRGHRRKLDVATILQGETRFFSILMLAWGLIADIDIESEKFRWMGGARIDLYALKRIWHLRKYNGRISFVPAPGFEAYGDPSSYRGESPSKPPISSSNGKELLEGRYHRYKGPDFQLENLGWRTIEGPFISVWLHNVPWGSQDTMAAPNAKFADGYLDLIVMRDCPKGALLSLMTELNNGDHVKSPYVMYLKVKAFVLEPGSRTKDPSKEGIIDSDGEVLARGNGTYKNSHKSLLSYGKLQVTVDQGLATVFSPI